MKNMDKDTGTQDILPINDNAQMEQDRVLSKKYFPLVFSAIFVVLIVIGLGYLFYRDSAGTPDISSEAVSVPSTNELEPVLNKSLTGARLVEPVYFVNEGEAYNDAQIVKIGEITQGKYAGWDLLVYETGEGMKSSYRAGHARLASKEKQIVYFPRLSTTQGVPFIESDLLPSFFERNGFVYSQDDEFTIPELEFQKVLVSSDGKQIRFKGNFYGSYYNAEELSQPDNSIITRIEYPAISNFLANSKSGDLSIGAEKVPGFDNVYMERHDPGLFLPSASGTFPGIPKYEPDFFVAHPDGLVVLYVDDYDLDIPTRILSIDGRRPWDENDVASFDSFYFGEMDRCSGSDELSKKGFAGSYVPQSFFRDGDLIPIATTKGGRRIYSFPTEHPFLKQRYEKYKGDLAYTRKRIGQGYLLPETIFNSFDEFAQSFPYVFIEDPYGRYEVRYHRGITSISLCEPVIYLYPQTKQQVDVRVSGVNIFNSLPAIDDSQSWHVTAEPSGQIITSDGIRYPYLFWEGDSVVLPPQPEGFVLPREQVSTFLSQKLTYLGLNDTEIDDFKKFWLPGFMASPYVFMSFVPQEVTDKLAPLSISPKPDTVIRVLVDYYPLTKPIPVKEQRLERAPARTGFTVIEWGGILR